MKMSNMTDNEYMAGPNVENNKICHTVTFVNCFFLNFSSYISVSVFRLSVICPSIFVLSLLLLSCE